MDGIEKKMIEGVLILKERDIRELIGIEDAIPAVEKAFALHAQGFTDMPPKSYVSFPGGDMRAMPAFINHPEMYVAGVKTIGVHPGNSAHNKPTVNGTITLVNPDTGEALAFMDANYLTALRTAAASGVAIKYLANPNPEKATLIGAGLQAGYQFDALVKLHPNIAQIAVYDLDPSRSRWFAQRPYHFEQLKPYTSLEGALEGASIVITTTPAREPYITRDMIAPKALICAIGADAKGKQELATDLTATSRIVVDNWEQASHSGEINVPYSTGAITKRNVHAELGDVVAGKARGRARRDNVIIFDSTGLAIQDMAVAHAAYSRAMENPHRYIRPPIR